MSLFWILGGLGVFLVGVVVHDVTQRKHAILRNFPIIGHFRYMLEAVGPELRQYIVTDNDEERPFSRDQRRWVYASSKLENNYFGFGTDNDLEQSSNYLTLRHAAFPIQPGGPDPHGYPVPCAKILGAARGRRKAFRPPSVVNVSGMSYGSLSSKAIEAINRGVQLAGCLHNTGEGGVSPYHRMGGELIWQIGTGYFGCRDDQGRFSLERLRHTCEVCEVRALEIKLSQGAKPGLGGLLPGAKVTSEIALIRCIPQGVDCHSPAGHSAFRNVDEMLDFVELLAEETGLPVGIKSAVGEMDFWYDLARLMLHGDRGVDFIAIDGAEGGTGAAPLAFSDHVALPFKLGHSRVYRAFAEAGLHEKIVFIGSGKLGFPEQAALAMALGCDMVHVAREALLSIGCIQAQRCHTGHCPAGVATQNRWLMRGLDPTDKSARLANYICTLRKEMLLLSRAAGVEHPGLVTADRFEILNDRFDSQTARELFHYEADWGLPSPEDQAAIIELMRAQTKTVQI
ncbi:MAG: FMN-binding glutamate synthase family protein [Acidobacteria bacterium]|nr:FMN-binding glutamate synthase family protein [Acidobacteriota bacterium]